jgi:hypothetical protein
MDDMARCMSGWTWSDWSHVAAWQAVVNVIAAGEVGNDIPSVSESIWRARV